MEKCISQTLKSNEIKHFMMWKERMQFVLYTVRLGFFPFFRKSLVIKFHFVNNLTKNGHRSAASERMNDGIKTI